MAKGDKIKKQKDLRKKSANAIKNEADVILAKVNTSLKDMASEDRVALMILDREVRRRNARSKATGGVFIEPPFKRALEKTKVNRSES